MNKLKLTIFLSIVCFGFLLLVPTQVQAQSMVLAPNSGSLNVGSSTTIEIRAANPPSETNAFSLRMSVPSPLSVQSITAGAKTVIFQGQCNTGLTPDPGFTNHSVCVDGSTAAGVYFSDGDVLATIVVNGDVEGTAVVSFITNNEFAYGNPIQQVSYTGTGGTYTVVGTGGTLPDTGILDSLHGLIPFVGAGLIGLGIYLWRFRDSQQDQ